MLTSPTRILLAGGAVLVTVAASGGLGYKFGRDNANAECLETNLDTAVKYAEGWQSAVEATRHELKTAQAREIARAQREAATKGRQVKEREEYEVAVRRDRDADPGVVGGTDVACSLDPDAYGLLIQAIERANAALGYGDSK